MSMTEHEAAKMIVTLWRLEHSVSAIQSQMQCLGAPLAKERILAAVKIYVDFNDEARRMQRPKRLA